eukprot:Hpha_TRINITY_DN8215_c0_g1::TRINITY_DN8215_c0_g1_i1::g.111956::m.111956
MGLDTTALLSGAVGAAAVLVAERVARGCFQKRITRLQTKDPRASGVVKYNGVAYVSGQVAIIDQLATSDIRAQTQQTLAKIDDLLREAGTDKSRLLEGRVWVKDISAHFVGMNEVWNAWVDPTNKPARYCVQSEMARPAILVEIMVQAACD